jgi:NTE family protein
MGNPALKLLVRYCQAPDIVIVQINPTHREGLPCTAPQILDRLNEINFNANFLWELHRMAVITRLVKRGESRDPRVRSARIFPTSSTRRRGVS